MYFVEKVGVYGHGVFWIGESVDLAIEVAKDLAEKDSDNYHDWTVYKFNRPSEKEIRGDADHEKIFSISKQEPVAARKPDASR